jgi:hypothetical protein
MHGTPIPESRQANLANNGILSREHRSPRGSVVSCCRVPKAYMKIIQLWRGWVEGSQNKASNFSGNKPAANILACLLNIGLVVFGSAIEHVGQATV